MSRKVIGITSGFYYVDDDIFRDHKITGICQDYIHAITRAKALPIAIPTFNSTEEDIDEYINIIDMLILSGGEDVSPEFYSEDRLQKLGRTNYLRDTHELLLIEKAIENNIPILGICRGMQLINSYFGGTLYQDLSYVPFETIEHIQKERPEVPTQIANFDKDTFLGNYFQNEVLINTFHHQVINTLAKDFVAVAHTNDGIIEAIEHSYLPIYGIQWHPEMMAEKDNEIMQSFFNYIFNSLS